MKVYMEKSFEIKKFLKSISDLGQIADLLEITRTTLGAKIEGRTPWTIRDVLAISEAGGLSPYEVFALLADIHIDTPTQAPTAEDIATSILAKLRQEPLTLAIAK